MSMLLNTSNSQCYSMKNKWLMAFSFWILLFSHTALGNRTVTDQLGRSVVIPDHVKRVVVLQHQTLDLLLQLNAQDKLVGILSSWKQHLGANYLRLDPALAHLSMPGDLTQVNIESLLALKPQVVFITNYAPPCYAATTYCHRHSCRGHFFTERASGSGA